MPVIVDFPTDGSNFGPGFLYRASWTPTVAVVDPHWFVNVRNNDGQSFYEEDIGGGQFTNTVSDWLQSRLFAKNTTLTAFQQLRDGQTGSVELGVVSDGVVDAVVTRSIVWDGHSQVGQQLVTDRPGTSSGGFTQSDRDVLNGLTVNTMASLPTIEQVSRLAQVPLSDFFRSPPPGLLRRAETVLISGSGSLTRPLPLSPVAAYGAVYDFVTVPAGYGFAVGHVAEYDRRLGQFSAVFLDAAGNETPDVIVDAHGIHGTIRWQGTPFPQRIDYDIAPGVVCSWTWLVFILSSTS